MLRPAFVEELHCPYCGSGLALEHILATSAEDIEHGVVRCSCYRYPILDGILILRQQSGPADTHDTRVSHLLAGDVEQARYRAMHVDAPLSSVVRRPWQRVRQLLAARGVPLPAATRPLAHQAGVDVSADAMSFSERLASLRPGLYSQYLYQRYANNSFLASVAPLLLLGDLASGQRILELTCGIGHSAYLIQSLFPHLQLVATDHDFVNLSIARRHFVPGAQLVCLDAEVPLPFADGSYGAVFCLDGFHYLRSKVALVKELNRVTEPQALWLFPHLHNALQENFNAGIPLDPAGYARCFNDVPHRILAESTLLRDFHQDGALRLDRDESSEDLLKAANLTLVGTRRRDFWRARTDLVPRLARCPSTLIVNPIYQVEHHGPVERLTLSWPSPRLRAECQEVEDYMPSSCSVDAGLLQRVRRGQALDSDVPALEELARRFILVNLPRSAYR